MDRPGRLPEVPAAAPLGARRGQIHPPGTLAHGEEPIHGADRQGDRRGRTSRPRTGSSDRAFPGRGPAVRGRPARHGSRAGPQINKALIELALGRAEQAEKTARAAADVIAATRGIADGHTTLVEARTVLARCLLALGRTEEAFPIVDWECRSGTARLGAGHPEVLDARFVRAECRRALGRTEEASAEHAAVLEARRRVLGPDHPDTLESVKAAS